MAPPRSLVAAALLLAAAALGSARLPRAAAQGLSLSGLEDWAATTIGGVAYPELIYFRLRLSGWWNPVANISISIPAGTNATVGAWATPTRYTITVGSPGTDPSQLPRLAVPLRDVLGEPVLLPVPVEQAWVAPGGSSPCAAPSCVPCGGSTKYTLDVTPRPYSVLEVGATPTVRFLPLAATFQAAAGYVASARWANAVPATQYGSLVGVSTDPTAMTAVVSYLLGGPSAWGLLNTNTSTLGDYLLVYPLDPSLPAAYAEGFLLTKAQAGWYYNGTVWRPNATALLTAVSADASAWAAAKAAACAAGTDAGLSALPSRGPTLASVVSLASTNANRVRSCLFMRTARQRMPPTATSYNTPPPPSPPPPLPSPPPSPSPVIDTGSSGDPGLPGALVAFTAVLPQSVQDFDASKQSDFVSAMQWAATGGSGVQPEVVILSILPTADPSTLPTTTGAAGQVASAYAAADVGGGDGGQRGSAAAAAAVPYPGVAVSTLTIFGPGPGAVAAAANLTANAQPLLERVWGAASRVPPQSVRVNATGLCFITQPDCNFGTLMVRADGTCVCECQPGYSNAQVYSGPGTYYCSLYTPGPPSPSPPPVQGKHRWYQRTRGATPSPPARSALPAPPPPPPKDASSDGGSTTGAIVGSVVGALALLALLAVCWKTRSCMGFWARLLGRFCCAACCPWCLGGGGGRGRRRRGSQGRGERQQHPAEAADYLPVKRSEGGDVWGSKQHLLLAARGAGAQPSPDSGPLQAGAAAPGAKREAAGAYGGSPGVPLPARHLHSSASKKGGAAAFGSLDCEAEPGGGSQRRRNSLLQQLWGRLTGGQVQELEAAPASDFLISANAASASSRSPLPAPSHWDADGSGDEEGGAVAGAVAVGPLVAWRQRPGPAYAAAPTSSPPKPQPAWGAAGAARGGAQPQAQQAQQAGAAQEVELPGLPRAPLRHLSHLSSVERYYSGPESSASGLAQRLATADSLPAAEGPAQRHTSDSLPPGGDDFPPVVPAEDQFELRALPTDEESGLLQGPQEAGRDGEPHTPRGALALQSPPAAAAATAGLPQRQHATPRQEARPRASSALSDAAAAAAAALRQQQEQLAQQQSELQQRMRQLRRRQQELAMERGPRQHTRRTPADPRDQPRDQQRQ
eukprot:scaffold9.g3195.t1